MNETLEMIRNRRSVRFFEERGLTREEMETIIEAGNQAATGANMQAWRFVVVTDSGVKKKLVMNAKPVYSKWMDGAPEMMKNMRKTIDEMMEESIYYSAPVTIFVIGTGFTSPNDCPMACQNMMVAARSLGIGSCWVEFGKMGLTEEIKTMFEMKDGETVFGPIVFGYPKGEFPAAPPKKAPIVKWI